MEMCLAKQLMSRQSLRFICRQTRSKSSGAAATAPKANVLSTSDFPLLLAEEQREICMDKMRKVPAFQYNSATNRNQKKSASVLIALCVERDSNEISMLFTRRSRHLRSHRLQISFPGGKRDETDASFVDCALRETEEEIGLPRERVQVWGEGSALSLPRSTSIVPVVGVVPDFHISQLQINCDEVEEAFSIPLNSLLTPSAARHTQFRGGFSAPVFAVDQHRIWGITGYITYIFLRCLLPSSMMPEALKTKLNFIRPYKQPPKPMHHHVESSKGDKPTA